MTTTLEKTQLSFGISGSPKVADDIPSLMAAGLVTPPPTKLPVGQYADLSDTKNLVASKSGMFWCYTHLADLPLEKQSSDPRYCKECFEILKVEAADLRSTGHLRRQWWLPQTTKLSVKETAHVVERHDGNMSTVKAKNSTVDKLSRSVAPRPGPKSKDLPMDLIKQLISEGQGSKVIAKRLTADGIPVSYKTIQRLLKKDGDK